MFQLISWYILTILKYKDFYEEKLVIILSIICIIAGGYFTMEYLKYKEKKKFLESTRGKSNEVYSL